MSENLSNQAGESTTGTQSTVDKITAAAGEMAAKAEEMFDKARASEMGQQAEAAWEKVEDKAEELLDKAKNSELGKKAEEVLDKLGDKAEALWDKIADKFDGDDAPPAGDPNKQA
jgi:Ser/Thr protein kinase RdoA (MazF antagonist)